MNVTEPLVAPVADAVIVAEVIALPLYDIASTEACWLLVIVTDDAGEQLVSKHSVTALLLLDMVTECENVRLPEIAAPDEFSASKPLICELLIDVPHAPLGHVPIWNDATAAVGAGLGVGLGLDDGNADADAVAVGELVGGIVGELDGVLVPALVGDAVGELVETGEPLGAALLEAVDDGDAPGDELDVG
ncbi:MAG TPA: hypothetical protein VMH02_08930 [Verrucomicrobiae bacterium]|nr:hypothetical protein [Verrucomicrobiae bacterium]